MRNRAALNAASMAEAISSEIGWLGCRTRSRMARPMRSSRSPRFMGHVPHSFPRVKGVRRELAPLNTIALNPLHPRTPVLVIRWRHRAANGSGGLYMSGAVYAFLVTYGKATLRFDIEKGNAEGMAANIDSRAKEIARDAAAVRRLMFIMVRDAVETNTHMDPQVSAAMGQAVAWLCLRSAAFEAKKGNGFVVRIGPRPQPGTVVVDFPSAAPEIGDDGQVFDVSCLATRDDVEAAMAKARSLR